MRQTIAAIFFLLGIPLTLVGIGSRILFVPIEQVMLGWRVGSYMVEIWREDLRGDE